jgi:hypothetical protein
LRIYFKDAAACRKEVLDMFGFSVPVQARRKLKLATGAVVTGLVLSLAACGGMGSQSPNSGQSSGSGSAPSQAPSSSGGGGGGGGGWG